jgi:hypothetical protein
MVSILETACGSVGDLAMADLTPQFARPAPSSRSAGVPPRAGMVSIMKVASGSILLALTGPPTKGRPPTNSAKLPADL